MIWCGRRPPRGGRGLKFVNSGYKGSVTTSPPSRGAWIEIINIEMKAYGLKVAPLAGGVD